MARKTTPRVSTIISRSGHPKDPPTRESLRALLEAVDVDPDVVAAESAPFIKGYDAERAGFEHVMKIADRDIAAGKDEYFVNDKTLRLLMAIDGGGQGTSVESMLAFASLTDPATLAWLEQRVVDRKARFLARTTKGK